MTTPETALIAALVGVVCYHTGKTHGAARLSAAIRGNPNGAVKTAFRAWRIRRHYGHCCDPHTTPKSTPQPEPETSQAGGQQRPGDYL